MSTVPPSVPAAHVGVGGESGAYEIESVSSVSAVHDDAENDVIDPPPHALASYVVTVPVHAGFFTLHVQPAQTTFALATASTRTGNPDGQLDTGGSCAMHSRKPVARKPQ